MKKTYGLGSVVFTITAFALIFTAYSLLLYRIYVHEHSRHMHVISGRSIYLYALFYVTFALFCATFVTTLYYFISRWFLKYQMVTIEDRTMKITSFNPWLRPITIAIDNINRVHLVANKTRPELTVVTPEGEINRQIATNYLALYNLHETLIAIGVPVYISGPSVRYFKMDKKKMQRTVFIAYAAVMVLMLFFVYRVMFHLYIGVHHR